nr:hypothetical protein [Tanacetum cinerariifolium]
MSTPKFATTYNLIAFLEKPSKSDGFEQIVDFLNANPIKYALTMSPTIYTSYGKKVVNEASIRHDLKLTDAEGTSCLSNAVIFEEFARMGAKTNSWNEFSSTMASAIICLANNQKFNFSKYILTSLVKNLEAGVPFYMFPRFIQTPIPDKPSSSQPQRKHKPKRKQRIETEVSPTKTNIEEYVPTPSNDLLPSGEVRMHIKELMELCTNLSNKVLDLENKVIEMKSSHREKIEELESRVEKLEEENRSLTKKLKSFNTRVESLTIKEIVVDKEESSKHRRKIADIDADAEDVVKDVVATAKNDEGINAATIPKISKDDVTLAQTLIEIKAAKPKAKGITMQELSEFRTTLPSQSSLPLHDKDKGKGLMVEPEMPLTRKDQIALDEEFARGKYQALKRKPVLVAQARKNMMIYLKNIAGYKMNYFKGMSYEQIRPIFEMEYNKVQAYLNKGPEMDAERIKVPRKRTRKEKVEKDQPAKKKKGNELEQDNTKKQKLEEQEEAEELKRNLEVVPDDEDDVFVNFTPLSSKPLIIVDYKIYKEGKKEHFQIIRANGIHQMYFAFSTMLKNFDREDLDVLWKIVKDRFKKSQPKEVLDVFLWHTLKVMFEHTVEDNTIQLFLLAKMMYPLTNYTLQQMFNEVRLQVDYEVEMAYDLLRLLRKQEREGYVSS